MRAKKEREKVTKAGKNIDKESEVYGKKRN